MSKCKKCNDKGYIITKVPALQIHSNNTIDSDEILIDYKSKIKSCTCTDVSVELS